jgi:hypothetical protein
VAPARDGQARLTAQGRTSRRRVEIAGEANEVAHAWRKGPKCRRSNTQTSGSQMATRPGTTHGNPTANPKAGKSRTTTESPPVRCVHGEEGPKTVDLHPKKQKPRTPARRPTTKRRRRNRPKTADDASNGTRESRQKPNHRRTTPKAEKPKKRPKVKRETTRSKQEEN